MHSHSVDAWEHQHVFLGDKHDSHERRTWSVVALTGVMMVAEIVAGSIFGSMALVADGWHMFTHAEALTISALAYRFASRHANDPRFSFGTGKFGELAAFTSAIVLALVALLIAYESATRLLSPVAIHFTEASVVAFIGLAVNLASAWLLFDEEHHHHHEDDDHHAHDHHHGHDTNIRAAYMHVLADMLTSVLAIVALLAGRFLGWVWLDPVMGILGALLIARWSWGLLRSAGAVLLDVVPNPRLAAALREAGGRRRQGFGPSPVAPRAWAHGPDPVHRLPPSAASRCLQGAPCRDRRLVSCHRGGASLEDLRNVG
jgi:cation diffusion facilitator family transporter